MADAFSPPTRLWVLDFLPVARTYAKGSFRLPFDKLRMYGSMVFSFECSFFALQGEKRTFKKQESVCLRKSK
jgi:hypothetical protein